MTEQQMMAKIGALLSSLHEIGLAPESMIMLGLQLSLDEYFAIRNVLVKTELAIVSCNAMSLTAKGRELAAKCYEAEQQILTNNAEGDTP